MPTAIANTDALHAAADGPAAQLEADVSTRVCRVDAVPAAGLLQVQAGQQALCVAQDGDTWLAVQARCPHQGVPLCEGHLEAGMLTCLEHLWQWDLRRGGVACGRAEQPLQVWRLQRIGDELHRLSGPLEPQPG